MLAAESVQEGALLLQVPEQLMLSANTALKSKLCGKLVRDAELSEWQVGPSITAQLRCVCVCWGRHCWGNQATYNSSMNG